MGIVTNILGTIDRSIQATGGQFFESTATALGPLASILATILVITVGLNVAIGAYNLSIQDSLRLIWRICLVFTFALSWRNFGTLYVALSDGAGNLAMSFFDITGGGPRSPNAAMDAFSRQMADTADGVLSARGAIARGVLGALLYLVLAGLMASYVLIVGFSKIMMAFLLGVAPLAMILALFDKTRSQFESWLSSFIGYLLYPVAAAALIATIAAVAAEQFTAQENVGTLYDLLGFLVVALVGGASLLAIPKAVSHITGQFQLASITPQPMRAVARPLTGAVAERARIFGAGMMTGGIKRREAADLRERTWAERGGKLAEKIRLSQILRPGSKG